MAKSEEQMEKEIRDHMGEPLSAYKYWYVGITEDARRRLFDEHNVDEKNDRYIWRTASSSDVARRIELYFVELGTDGGAGGGDEDAQVVYAYRKQSHTSP